jgi:hypothetical protein
MQNYINSFLFRPPRPLPVYPDTIRQECTDKPACVTSECLEIFEKTGIPSVLCAHPHARRVVVFSHGNSETIVSCGWFLAELCRALHADVYAFEYEGYFTREEVGGCAPHIPPALIVYSRVSLCWV